MSVTTEKPKPEYSIYVACLAAYNNGYLHGAWIDATQEPEEIEAEVQAMLAMSPVPKSEEWAIHDYDLGGVSISEYESFATVSAIAKAVEEHGSAFAAYIGHVGIEYSAQDWDAVIEQFREAYRGEYVSMANFAEEWASDCYGLDAIPAWLANHIDWESLGKEMELDSFWNAESPSGVYVFERK